MKAVRIINTAEVANRSSQDIQYRTLEELQSAGALRQAEGMFRAAPVPSITEPVPGFKVRLVVSEDCKHYQISVTPDKAPYSGFFSDEQGIIYEGRPLERIA